MDPCKRRILFVGSNNISCIFLGTRTDSSGGQTGAGGPSVSMMGGHVSLSPGWRRSTVQ